MKSPSLNLDNQSEIKQQSFSQFLEAKQNNIKPSLMDHKHLINQRKIKKFIQINSLVNLVDFKPPDVFNNPQIQSPDYLKNNNYWAVKTCLASQESKSQSWIPAQNYAVQFNYSNDNKSHKKHPSNMENLRKHILGNISCWNKDNPFKNTPKINVQALQDQQKQIFQKQLKSYRNLLKISNYLAKPLSPVMNLKKIIDKNFIKNYNMASSIQLGDEGKRAKTSDWKPPEGRSPEQKSKLNLHTHDKFYQPKNSRLHIGPEKTFQSRTAPKGIGRSIPFNNSSIINILQSNQKLQNPINRLLKVDNINYLFESVKNRKINFIKKQIKKVSSQVSFDCSVLHTTPQTMVNSYHSRNYSTQEENKMNEKSLDDEKKQIKLNFYPKIEEMVSKIIKSLELDVQCVDVLGTFLQADMGQLQIQLDLFFSQFYITQKTHYQQLIIPNIVIQKIKSILLSYTSTLAQKELILIEIFDRLDSLKPKNLLEEMGGYKQIERIMRTFIRQFKEQQLEKEIGINIHYISTNFQSVCKALASYFKNDTDVLELKDKDITKYNFQLSNLDFFIIKIKIWKILVGIYVPYDIQMKILSKYEKLRYKITQEACNCAISRGNGDVVDQIMLGLKACSLKLYIKVLGKMELKELSLGVIDFMLGVKDHKQILKNFEGKMKKKINVEFLQNFYNLCMDCFYIYVKNPVLIRDFQHKFLMLEVELGFKIPMNHYLDDMQGFLENLSHWIVREQAQKVLETDLIRQDVEKIDILEFFFYFYLANDHVFSYQDFFLARPYFCTSDELLKFWLEGIKNVLENLKCEQKEIHKIYSEIEESFFFHNKK